MHDNYKPTSITITYLAYVSFASLNGGDSDTDNINVIKKITASDGKQFPYVSSQAIRRALRDQLTTLGLELSPVTASGTDNEKHPPMTQCNPVAYIDDDLFGYMNAQKETIKRTSPIRVSPLIALSEYKADLDFGTNYMGKDTGYDPNIFETEMHRGVYRGTILIELDRIGTQDGFIIQDKKSQKTDNSLDNILKAGRLFAFIDAFQNLWSSGRQSRFLADISPKFIAAAYLKSKNPIFLEALDACPDISVLNSIINDYSPFIQDSVYAAAQSFITLDDPEVKTLQDGYKRIKSWINNYYSIE